MDSKGAIAQGKLQAELLEKRCNAVGAGLEINLCYSTSKLHTKPALPLTHPTSKSYTKPALPSTHPTSQLHTKPALPPTHPTSKFHSSPTVIQLRSHFSCK
ncbi:MAG: hypothetical protein LDL41_10595 [Coleofasciculus sp. S288]|nr:hypothetical protein [Coleofasciculus sp. S288]